MPFLAPFVADLSGRAVSPRTGSSGASDGASGADDGHDGPRSSAQSSEGTVTDAFGDASATVSNIYWSR